MTTTSSSFSLRRVAQLYSFNGPWLRKQMAIYLAVSLATALLYIFGRGHFWQMPVNGICDLALGVMFILSPLVFIKGGDCRIIERLIPASAAEKFTFHISYLLLIIPACYLFPWLAEKFFAPDYQFVADVRVNVEHAIGKPAVISWISHLSSLSAMVTCYFCVVYARSGRMLKGVMLSLAVIIVFNIIGALVAAMEAFMIGLDETGMNPENMPGPQEISGRMLDAMHSQLAYTYVIIGLFSAYIAVMLVMSYRSLHHRNL